MSLMIWLLFFANCRPFGGRSCIKLLKILKDSNMTHVTATCNFFRFFSFKCFSGWLQHSQWHCCMAWVCACTGGVLQDTYVPRPMRGSLHHVVFVWVSKKVDHVLSQRVGKSLTRQKRVVKMVVKMVVKIIFLLQNVFILIFTFPVK